jgi:Acetyltransferase (GNAT) domain
VVVGDVAWDYARMESHVVALTDIDGPFIDRWRVLSNRTDITPNPYFDADFLLPAAACMSEAKGLRLLVGEDHGDLVWLMPLVPSSQLGSVPMLSGLRNCVPRAYYGQPLVVAGYESAAAAFVLRYLSESRNTFWLRLQMLDADDLFAQSLVAGRGHASVHVEAITRGLAVRRPEADYLSGNSNAEQLRRQRLLFETSFGEPLDVVDCSADPHAVDDFLAMESAGGKCRASLDFAAEQGHAEFLRQMCSNFRDRGQLQLRSLRAGDQTVGMKLRLMAGAALFCYVIAFAAGYEELFAGLQLEVENFRFFHDQPRFVLMDSCAPPGNMLFNSLYPDQRSLVNLTVGSGPLGWAVTSLGPAARPLTRRRRAAAKAAAGAPAAPFGAPVVNRSGS